MFLVEEEAPNCLLPICQAVGELIAMGTPTVFVSGALLGVHHKQDFLALMVLKTCLRIKALNPQENFLYLYLIMQEITKFCTTGKGKFD